MKNKPKQHLWSFTWKISSWYASCMGTCLLILMVHAALAQKKTMQKSKTDFGVVFNEDGDFAFLSPDPVLAEKLLRLNVASHAALGVKTYTFSIGAGSDVLYYNTKIASPYGWRKTKYELQDSGWAARLRSARTCIASGLDAVNIAGKEARRQGMFFVPSMRMNDSHFMADPYNYPLTGKFWVDNGEKYKIGSSPILFDKNYGNLFDYSHKEVRDFRYAVFNEAVELHKDIIDGFELDFNRVQVFFPKGKANEGMPYMTALLRSMRQRLNALSKEKGKPMYLFVRIPPSMESCVHAGLDIQTWIKEGLVDLVSPSQLMTLAHDMPIQDMIKLAKQNDVQVYPSLFPRTSFRKAMVPSAEDLGLEHAYGRKATLPELMGAASNYAEMGADGFYLFNFKGGEKDEGFRPHPDWMYALVGTLKTRMSYTGEKVYAVTKTYYNDNQLPSYAYAKQLPLRMQQKTTFQILVGEHLSESVFPVKSCVLRLGLGEKEKMPLSVRLNGTELLPVHAFDELSSTTNKKLPPDLAMNTVVYAINEPMILKKGVNEVEVDAGNALVTDIEIGVSHFSQLDLFMLGKKIPPINQFLKNYNHIQKEK